MHFTNWRTFRIWECCWWQAPIIFLPNSRRSLVTTEVLHPSQVASSLTKFPSNLSRWWVMTFLFFGFSEPDFDLPICSTFLFSVFWCQKITGGSVAGSRGSVMMVCPWTCFIHALQGPLFWVPWVDSEGSKYLEVLPAFLNTLKLLCKWAMLPR